MTTPQAQFSYSPTDDHWRQTRAHALPTLFNLSLERVMQETLHSHITAISTGGRPICNLRFADDIDLMAGSKRELQELINKFIAKADAYGMEQSTEKSKVMMKITNIASVSVIIDGEKLDEESSFRYLRVILTKDGTCSAEIRLRIAAATAAMARLTRVWKNNISFRTKSKLYKSLVVSIFVYGFET